MPFYEWSCPGHGRFLTRQPMSEERKADCPECHQPAEPRVSACSFRSAEPLVMLQDLGTYPDGSHKGYQEIGRRADSGISPKPGQPYKTGEQVKREEYGGLEEV